jgi:hypothetical protein
MTMRSNSQQSDSSEAAFRLGRDSAVDGVSAPALAGDVVSNALPGTGRDGSRFGRALADRRSAPRAPLDPADHEVFSIWARRVTVFYLVVIGSLLGAMLLSTHVAVDRQGLVASPAAEHGPAHQTASRAADIGK